MAIRKVTGSRKPNGSGDEREILGVYGDAFGYRSRGDVHDDIVAGRHLYVVPTRYGGCVVLRPAGAGRGRGVTTGAAPGEPHHLGSLPDGLMLAV